jgi:UDP-glucose 4-epimerase
LSFYFYWRMCGAHSYAFGSRATRIRHVIYGTLDHCGTLLGCRIKEPCENPQLQNRESRYAFEGLITSLEYFLWILIMSNGPILITGGAGFIGSHLTDALLARGYAVRILDDLSTGKVSNLPLDNPRVELIEGDVADAAVVARAMAGCRAVAHLAAVASVQASVDDPVRTHQSNFVGTLNVCEAMRQANVKRVVFASSAAVYGNNGEGLAIDEDTPKAPLTPYASDKLASEYYFEFYRRQHALEPVVFRFFNIFGPRQDPSSPYSGVISIFSERAQKGLPITIFGDGEQTRDFFYVEDLVGVLVQALEAPQVEVGAINVGMNKATSLNQMLSVLAEVLGAIPPVNHSAARSGDIRHSRANNQRLLERFKVAEPTAMSVGLARLLG